MSFLDDARARARGCGSRIVYAEGLEERAMRAAALLREQDLARPILLGPAHEIQARARGWGIDLVGVATRDPATDPVRPELDSAYVELRAHKGMTAEKAREVVARPHYFGALLVRAGEAEGMVSGLSSETKPFLPAFEIVKTRPGFGRVSSVFIMSWPERTLFFADCSVNIHPHPATLAEIGRATAATVRSFGLVPKVAFLSFSTRGSAQDASVDKVREAVRLARGAEPELALDGEMQFDAAFVPAVAGKKCPDSPLQGQANVFVFPDLDAGNIAYKITERLAGAAAVGPILQGLNRPINDVSRGCSAQDLADVAVITALQARG
jgi:phosphate acetyltransferase